MWARQSIKIMLHKRMMLQLNRTFLDIYRKHLKYFHTFVHIHKYKNGQEVEGYVDQKRTIINLIRIVLVYFRHWSLTLSSYIQLVRDVWDFRTVHFPVIITKNIIQRLFLIALN